MEFEYRKELKTLYQQKKAHNKAYSLRAFARDLGISVASLSQVFSAKRDFSKKNALKVADKLCWSPQKTASLLEQLNRLPSESTSSSDALILLEDEFALISEWYHLAILSMAKQKKCPADTAYLAETLGLNSKIVLSAIQRLERLGYLKIHNSFLQRTAADLRTTQDIPSVAIRRYHLDNLEVARNALENVPTHLREISSITLNIDPEKIAEAKKMIVEFKRRFTKKMEKTNPKKAYSLTVHFYPATLKKEGHLDN